MANTTSSQLDRSRPSSRLQPQSMLDATPVLFRLPSVQLQPLPPVADFPAESLMEFQSERPAEDSAVNPTAKPVPASEVQTKVDNKEESGSWWEHWSSGVVLILLLIAAYFACIAVLRSRDRKASALAKESSEHQDANDLMVPPVITEIKSDSGLADSSAADQLVNSLSSDLTVELQPTEGSPPMATAELLEPKQMLDLPLLDSFQSNGSSMNSLPIANQLGQSPSLYDGANASQPSKTAPNLGEPAASGSQQPLSSSLTVPTLSGSSNPSIGIGPGSFTLSGPSGPSSSFAGNTSAGNTSAGNPPAGTPAAGSITTATLSTNANGASFSGTSTPSNGGTGIPNLITSTQPQQPTTSTVSAGMNSSSTSGGAQPGSSSGIRNTSTPEAKDEVESIIRAYIELSRAGQIQSSSSTSSNNRYQPTR